VWCACVLVFVFVLCVCVCVAVATLLPSLWLGCDGFSGIR
jgi:hypothetical protein